MNDTAELTFRDVTTAKPAPEIATEVVDRADISSGKAIVSYGATERALAQLRERYAGATYDLTTTKGDAAARAARLELTTLRTALEKRRREFKAPALDFGKLIDSEAARITAEIRKLEDPIDAQIKADEERRERERESKRQIEIARVAKHRASIDTVKNYAALASAPGMTAARITRGIVALTEMQFGPEFEEFQDEITKARNDTVLVLEDLRAKAVAREEEAARLEQQRIENERVAAENARIAADLKRRADELAALQAEQNAAARMGAAMTAAIQRVGIEAVNAALRVDEGRTEPLTVEEMDGCTALLDSLQPAVKITHEDAQERGSSPADVPAAGTPATYASNAAESAEAAPSGEQGPGAHADTSAPEPATLKLGDINAKLGVTMTRDFIEATLGIAPAGTDKRAALFRPSQFPAICDALIAHIQKARAA